MILSVCKAVSKPDHDPEMRLEINRYAHRWVQYPRQLDSLKQGGPQEEPAMWLTEEMGLLGHLHPRSVLAPFKI